MTLTKKATIHDLPLEILEMVIKRNRSDREAVLSASLVCHKWRTASLETLFHSVPLSHDDQFRQCLETAQRYPALLRRGIRKVKFAPGSRFERNDHNMYRDLHAESLPPMVGCTGCAAEAEEPEYIWDLYHDPPIDLIPLPAMRGVRSLNWYAPSDEPMQNIVTVAMYLLCFPSLVKLTLHARFMNVQQAKMFLYFCGSSLQELKLESVYTEAYDSEDVLTPLLSASYLPRLSGLKRLKIGGISHHDVDPQEEDRFFRDVLIPHPPTSLQKIWLSSHITPDTFGRLLNMCLHSLSDLTISVDSSPLWEKDKLPAIFSAKAFPKLNKMEFGTISLNTYADDGSKILDWYRDLIKVLPDKFAPNLHSLSLHFLFFGNGYADFVRSWNKLKPSEHSNFTGHAFALEDVSRKFPALQKLALSFTVFNKTKITKAEKEKLDQVVLGVFPDSDELNFNVMTYWHFEMIVID